MADNVGRGNNNRGRGAPRRYRGHHHQANRGHRGGRGEPRGQGHQQHGGHFQGHRQGQTEDTENDVVEAVAPSRELPRRRVYIGSAALDRMQQLDPEDLLLQITNRVSSASN